ncbi:MAG: DNA integrity scanning protein DisA nucleotide-binding domain protein [Desulfobacterales bacterium]
MTKSLGKMDGALHIRVDLKLHCFAFILRGLSISNEDRARGVRFNSALRFTAKNPNTIVVVVSEDRTVSLI